MATHIRPLHVTFALTLGCGLLLFGAMAIQAQDDFDQRRAADDQDTNTQQYERYRDSQRSDRIPPPPPRPPRRIEPRVPEARVVPRYDDPALDDYWHDRLQQYRFQDWYGDNYRRYWAPNYRGYFRKQNPPYSWWNAGESRRALSNRAWQDYRD